MVIVNPVQPKFESKILSNSCKHPNHNQQHKTSSSSSSPSYSSSSSSSPISSTKTLSEYLKLSSSTIKYQASPESNHSFLEALQNPTNCKNNERHAPRPLFGGVGSLTQAMASGQSQFSSHPFPAHYSTHAGIGAGSYNHTHSHHHHFSQTSIHAQYSNTLHHLSTVAASAGRTSALATNGQVTGAGNGPNSANTGTGPPSTLPNMNHLGSTMYATKRRRRNSKNIRLKENFLCNATAGQTMLYGNTNPTGMNHQSSLSLNSALSNGLDNLNGQPPHHLTSGLTGHVGPYTTAVNLHNNNNNNSNASSNSASNNNSANNNNNNNNNTTMTIPQGVNGPGGNTKTNPSKRHRERLNSELDMLASLLPFEQSVLSKLDKLSILRLSVSYLRTKSYFHYAMRKDRESTLELAQNSNTKQSSTQPNHDSNKTGNGFNLLSNSHLYSGFGQHSSLYEHNKLNSSVSSVAESLMEGDLILQALNGFLLILTCEGEVFYTSHTVETYLGFHQSDICHQSVYELVHSEDREELQRQLMWNSALSPDRSSLKLDQVLQYENCHMLERNFTVRFRCLLDNTSGFLRLDVRGRIKVLYGQNHKSDEPPLALFAVCTPFGPPSLLEMPANEKALFKSKHRLDFSLLSMEPRGRSLLGYNDAEMSNRGGYDLVHHDDLFYVASAHQELLKTGASGLIAYRMVMKDCAKWQWLQTSARLVYKNSKPDFILCTHRPLMEEEGRDLLSKRTMDFKVTYLDGGLGAITVNRSTANGLLKNCSLGAYLLGDIESSNESSSAKNSSNESRKRSNSVESALLAKIVNTKASTKASQDSPKAASKRTAGTPVNSTITNNSSIGATNNKNGSENSQRSSCKEVNKSKSKTKSNETKESHNKKAKFATPSAGSYLGAMEGLHEDDHNSAHFNQFSGYGSEHFAASCRVAAAAAAAAAAGNAPADTSGLYYPNSGQHWTGANSYGLIPGSAPVASGTAPHLDLTGTGGYHAQYPSAGLYAAGLTPYSAHTPYTAYPGQQAAAAGSSPPGASPITGAAAVTAAVSTVANSGNGSTVSPLIPASSPATAHGSVRDHFSPSGSPPNNGSDGINTPIPVPVTSGSNVPTDFMSRPAFAHHFSAENLFGPYSMRGQYGQYAAAAATTNRPGSGYQDQTSMLEAANYSALTGGLDGSVNAAGYYPPSAAYYYGSGEHYSSAARNVGQHHQHQHSHHHHHHSHQQPESHATHHQAQSHNPYSHYPAGSPGTGLDIASAAAVAAAAAGNTPSIWNNSLSLSTMIKQEADVETTLSHRLNHNRSGTVTATTTTVGIVDRDCKSSLYTPPASASSASSAATLLDEPTPTSGTVLVQLSGIATQSSGNGNSHQTQSQQVQQNACNNGVNASMGGGSVSLRQISSLINNSGSDCFLSPSSTISSQSTIGTPGSEQNTVNSVNSE